MRQAAAGAARRPGSVVLIEPFPEDAVRSDAPTSGVERSVATLATVLDGVVDVRFADTAGAIRRAPRRAVLHLHSVYSVRNLLLSVLRPRFVVTPHGGYRGYFISPPSRLKRIVTCTAERSLLTRALAVQVLSEAEAADVRAIALRARTWVQPFPVAEVPGAPRTYPGRPDVLYVGRIDVHHKGLDVLLDAWGGSALEPVARLTIAGCASDADRELVAGLVARYCPLADVRVLGRQNDAQRAELATRHAYFVHASRREGMPLGVLEAMSAGMPTVLTRGTNLVDLQQRYGAGFDGGADAAGLRAAFDAVAAAAGADYAAQSAAALRLVRTEFAPAAFATAFADRLR